jgi:hypothetical protein
MTDELTEIRERAELGCYNEHGETVDILISIIDTLTGEKAALEKKLAEAQKQPTWLCEALNEGDGVYRP